MARESGRDQARAQFAERLRQALHRCGIGRREYARLGAVVGVTKQAARAWVEGHNLPTREHIAVLAQTLGVRQAWLEYGEGRMFPGEEVLVGEAAAQGYEVQAAFTLDEREKQLLLAYRRLDVTSRAAVEQLVHLLGKRVGPDSSCGGDL